MAGRPNPILAFALTGGAQLSYPPWHEMVRWEAQKRWMPYIGKLNETLSFANLPTSVQSLEMAVKLGAIDSGPGGACQK